MLTIYLSGAISNKDINIAKKEFAEAERKIKKDLKTLKIDKNYCEIINPFRVLKINKKYKYEDYLKADIIELIDCDIVVDIQNAGHKKSKGRKLEIAIARALKIKVYAISSFLQMFYIDYIKGEQQ